MFEIAVAVAEETHPREGRVFVCLRCWFSDEVWQREIAKLLLQVHFDTALTFDASVHQHAGRRQRWWPTSISKPSRRNFAPWPDGRGRLISTMSSSCFATSMSGRSRPAFADVLREKCTFKDIEVPRCHAVLSKPLRSANPLSMRE
jgi:hypothetical protein